jgi:hypothetical protein
VNKKREVGGEGEEQKRNNVRNNITVVLCRLS